MSRTVSVCLCAVLVFAVLGGVRLLDPPPALAATGTVTMETPLHDSPSPGAPLIALVPEGTVVSIDGPPVDGFYPVSTSGLSGWMRGETLQLQKDVADDGGAVATPAGDEGVPVEQTAVDDPATTEDAGETIPSDAGDLAAAADVNDAPADATVAETPVDTAITEPVDTAATTATPGPDAADPDATATETPVPLAGSAEGMAAPLGNDDSAAAATPVAESPATEPTDEAPRAPDFTPIPVATPGPSGPATVLTDMPITSGPGRDFGLIFTVPQGSTVEQTGQVIDGYVTVQYKEVSGWAPLNELDEPIEFQPESLPATEATPVETKTPKPGSGVAFTTVDLSLRAGPSATEEPIAAVPAGSRVILTGVMEGGFQRVTVGDEVGWIADDYLQSPDDPAPNGEGQGKQENYSERQIVRIIYQAAERYDQDRDDMLRVARCESNLDPYAVNPSGSYGLFQFIRTTWRSTPYGDEDIFDPQANANAAGWMWAQGRKSEWVCQ